MKPRLTIENLCSEAGVFAQGENSHNEPTLYGKTDGKAIGTYLEQKFTAYLSGIYSFERGNSASGIDFPDIEVDLKVTSLKQPQSSCPFKSATQKIYGLGYHLLIFVYEKLDDSETQTGKLEIEHTIFVHKSRTADFQTTKGIVGILDRDGNQDDIMAFLMERNLPVDEIGAQQLAECILESPPLQGYLTISNALQWRLQYSRVLQQAGSVSGIVRVR